MTENTQLDDAHAAMQAAPGDDTARLQFFERLADAELFVLLTEEPSDDRIAPEVFDVADGRFVVVFDRVERLSAFGGKVVPYAAMSGRALTHMLAGQGIGLGVNLDVAPSSILLPASAIDWLGGLLRQTPTQAQAKISGVRAPSGLPQSVLVALDTKLASAVGLAQCAYLAHARYSDGRQGHVLAFVDASEQAQQALANAIGEALVFSGVDAGTLDVMFIRADTPVADRLAAAGLRFDLPQPSAPRGFPAPPGSDPSRPPVLRPKGQT